MPFNLLLLPLLGGYIFITMCRRTRYAAQRLDGYRLLLHASIAGLMLLLAAKVLIIGTRAVSTDAFGSVTWWRETIAVPYAGVATIAFLLGAMMWWPANFFLDVDKEIYRAARRKGDPMERFLRDAMSRTTRVLVTLKSGRVYVGLLTHISSPAEPVESIRLLPLYSGYRDERRQPRFIHNYVGILEAAYKSGGVQDKVVPLVAPDSFVVVIPVREIETASGYDGALHALHLAQVDSEPANVS